MEMRGMLTLATALLAGADGTEAQAALLAGADGTEAQAALLAGADGTEALVSVMAGPDGYDEMRMKSAIIETRRWQDVAPESASLSAWLEGRAPMRWVPGARVDGSAKVTDDWFVATEITDEVYERMLGRSFGAGCTTAREELRYLQIPHRNLSGETIMGEMVCHRSIAQDLLEIFRELYRAGYPIERMVLIDDYDADDVKSMEANNTSCFCYRKVAGSRRMSKHARGMAVDINPLYNPWVKAGADGRLRVKPEAGRAYVKRTGDASPYLIKADDMVVRLFKQHGFGWGGDWRGKKDYQHFEKR